MSIKSPGPARRGMARR